MLKRLFALSDKGVADLKKGGAASAFSSLSCLYQWGYASCYCEKYAAPF